MIFEFSDEHEELRRTLRGFFEREADEAALREQMASEAGFRPAVWTRMAEELGLAGLIVSEELGGAGFGPVELAIAMEEMGRALLCAPYLSSAVLATSALELAAHERARKELLPALASGRRRAALAFSERERPFELEAIALEAAGSGEACALTGEKQYVLDGATADDLLVVARAGAGLALFHVPGDARGLAREPLPPLDPTRKLARLRFESTPAMRISEGDAAPGLQRALDRACAALAAEQVGGAQRCLDMAVGYAKQRLQFGRPIGSYQAIKHQCADMLLEVEFARSAAYYAAFAARDAEPDAAVAASIAKSQCSEAYVAAAKRNLQIHGGMGFTWEHSAHLYLKRATASAVLFGTPEEHRRRVAAAVGIAAG